MDKSDILDYLKVGELITFECKKAENAIPKSVWETYSSFANTIGGTIILGIKENRNEGDVEKRFEILALLMFAKSKKNSLTPSIAIRLIAIFSPTGTLRKSYLIIRHCFVFMYPKQIIDSVQYISMEIC